LLAQLIYSLGGRDQHIWAFKALSMHEVVQRQGSFYSHSSHGESGADIYCCGAEIGGNPAAAILGPNPARINRTKH